MKYAFLAFLLAQIAVAAVIDFSTAPAGPSVSFVISGVTFSAVGGGGQITRETTPNGTAGLLDRNDPFRTLRADIAGGATSVSIDLGDYNADPDNLFLEIYDASDGLLDSISLLTLASDETMHTLTRSSSTTIAYAIFGATSPAIGGSSVYADNFAFSSDSVPEPSSFALIGAGILALAFRRYRR